jgi:tetratricopeptide (TPR) repeat protein
MRYLLGAWMLGVSLVVATGCGGGDDKSGGSGGSFQKRYDSAMKEKNPDQQARKLLKLAYDQEQGKDSAGAKQSLKSATSAAEKVTDPLGRSAIYTQLASTQAKLDNPADARSALRIAKKAIDELDSVETQASSLCAVAEVEGVRLKKPDDAVDTLRGVEKMAAKVEDPLGQARVLASAAATYGKVGEKKDAARVLESALALAQAVEDPVQRADAMTLVAKAQTGMKQTGAAVDTLNLATESARTIQNKYGQALALADIAEALSKAGQAAEAHKLLEEADKVADSIREPDLQQQAMKRVRELMGTLPDA